jgi:hypothetical protein
LHKDAAEDWNVEYLLEEFGEGGCSQEIAGARNMADRIALALKLSWSSQIN